jgi:threonine aldolase
MIDLRSDLVSVPTDAMWEAMRAAELGWATFGEDASVNALCERVAALLGKDAGLWVPTCGMGNLVAMLTFCVPGDRVVVEAASHVMTSEAMGMEEIARLVPRTLWAADGRMDPAAVSALVRDEGAALLILENTHTRAGGTTLSVPLTQALVAAAKKYRARVHLDGARLVNASVALGVPLADLAAPANSIVFSLNKALSAPMGAVLAGSEQVVERARLMLRRLGGASVHRAGIPAAAGLVALDTMVDGIADDHRRARDLGRLLAAVPGVATPEVIETNIVLADVTETGIEPARLVELLASAGLRVLERDTSRIRLVTHRLIGDEEIERAVAIVADTVERHFVPPLEVPEPEGYNAELDRWDWEDEEDEDDSVDPQ